MARGNVHFILVLFVLLFDLALLLTHPPQVRLVCGGGGSGGEGGGGGGGGGGGVELNQAWLRVGQAAGRRGAPPCPCSSRPAWSSSRGRPGELGRENTNMRIRRNHGGVKTMMDELWRKSLWLKCMTKFK